MSNELLSEVASGGKAFLFGEENRFSGEIASPRLARAAEPDSETQRRKKSAKKNQRKSKNPKKTAKKSKKNNVGKRKDNSLRKKAIKKKKSKSRRNSKKNKSMKGKGSSHKNEGNDGNTIVIVCPECPKESKILCKAYAEGKTKKLSKKDKKILKKLKKTEKKIARINRKMEKSRNGDVNPNDDDKLCKPCCDKPNNPAPAPAPAPATTSTPSGTTKPSTPPPAPPLDTDNCTECVKWTASVMDVWRVQVTNFEKQCKRVDKQTRVASSKANKTPGFTDLADLLMNSNCPNNKMEIDDLADNLNKCNASVTAACALTKVDEAFVKDCKQRTKAFVVSKF